MNSVEYDIKCPRCSAKAVAIMRPVGTTGTYREPTLRMGVRRLICEGCGLSKKVTAEDAEAYELWYAIGFRGHRLWARNRQHLLLLISWLSGDLRKQVVRHANSIEDKYLGARIIVESLPKWMVLAKNREGVLKCLRKMYDK